MDHQASFLDVELTLVGPLLQSKLITNCSDGNHIQFQLFLERSNFFVIALFQI